ncbi:MAG: hypothetical protein II488_00185 [Firmicutes bacterium]|nr:hypothetical protein [Bacillota bacterium]
MKVFVVFLALLTVLLSFVAYAADLDAYVKMQARLKYLAEDCAAAAALSLDPEAYSRGFTVIDRRAAEDVSDLLLMKAMRTPAFGDSVLSSVMVIFDDEKGYSGCAEYGLAEGIPSVVFTVTRTGNDLFRLPFAELREFSRTAAYQWDDSLTSFRH